MMSIPTGWTRTVSVLLLLTAGLGLGSILHDALPHAVGALHADEAQQTCAVCAASHHAWGDLTPMTGHVVTTSLVAEALPSPALIHPPTPDFRPSAPRSPPAV